MSRFCCRAIPPIGNRNLLSLPGAGGADPVVISDLSGKPRHSTGCVAISPS